MFKIQPTKNTWLIIYKLLNDLLFLLLIFFAFSLMADGLIPGIITSHISFLKITFLVALNLLAIYAVGSFSQIQISPRQRKKKTTIFLVVLAILLIFNSLIKLNLILAIFILLVSLAIGYLIYQSIFE